MQRRRADATKRAECGSSEQYIASLELVLTLSRRAVLQEMVRRILLLSLLVHALLAAEDGSSGVGSGEGSGEACIEPVPRPEPLGGSVGTGGDREPRCHIGCIERVRTQP